MAISWLYNYIACALRLGVRVGRYRLRVVAVSPHKSYLAILCGYCVSVGNQLVRSTSGFGKDTDAYN